MAIRGTSRWRLVSKLTLLLTLVLPLSLATAPSSASAQEPTTTTTTEPSPPPTEPAPPTPSLAEWDSWRAEQSFALLLLVFWSSMACGIKLAR